MAVAIAITRERAVDETRVAATPDSVRKLRQLGAEVVIEHGAGEAAAFSDAAYVEAGATIAPAAAAALKGAALVFKVRTPPPDEIAALEKGAVVLGMLDPHRERAALDSLAAKGAFAFAMEFVPRISRAQAMDVLSSQANLAGYRSVIEAAEAYGRAFPMMMTAAGTIAAAKCFVMGAGVAGLQAIATARRLGAVVTATDVRPAAKEQVESLGARFIAVEDEEFKQAETAAGYAREMSAEYRAKQAELVAGHIQKQDVVITTALIPGRPAPRLVSAAHVASMKRGSVIVDLAVEQGGNCELSRAGEISVTDNGVKIVGLNNLAGRVAADASGLYARNLNAFAGLIIKDGALAMDFEDEIVKGACVVREGVVAHPALAS